MKSTNSRNTKDPLEQLSQDIQTLKKIILKYLSPEEQADQLRNDRLNMILSGITPINMDDSAKVLLHVVPIQVQPLELVLSDRTTIDKMDEIGQICQIGEMSRFNVDGYSICNYHNQSDGFTKAYLQFFRKGCVELCTTKLSSTASINGIPTKSIYLPGLEEKISNYTKHIESFLQTKCNVGAIRVYLSLIGVHGCVAGLNRFSSMDDELGIDRDYILLDGQTIENEVQTSELALRKIFDNLWNAFGYAKSPYR